MSLIIGFGHKARHGKDEAIKAIVEHAGCVMDIRAYGFGDALKAEVNEAARLCGGMGLLFETLRCMHSGIGMEIHAALAGVPRLPAWVTFDENAPMDDPLCPYGKQRILLQWWGSEFRRAQDPDYWVKKLMQQIANDNPEVALVRDLRFINEFDAIHEAGGYTVKVVRQGFVSDVYPHCSETALDQLADLDWDDVVKVWNGDLVGLRLKAVDTFEFLKAVYESRPRDFSEMVADPLPDFVGVDSVLETALESSAKPWRHRFCQ